MAFPTVTTSIDTFTGGLGTRWTTVFGGGVKAVTVSGNGAISGNGTTGSNAGYYNVASYGPDFDLGVTWVADLGSGSWVSLGAVQNPGSGTTDGYVIYLSADGSSTLSYYRLDNDSFTQLGAGESYTETPGDVVGMERNGSTLNAHIKRSGSWTQYGTRSDSTYTTGTFFPFIDIHFDYDSNGLAMDDLFGGTLPTGGAVKRLLLMGCGS